MVILPNAKLAQSAIINCHLPEARMSLLFPIGVAYGSDPDMVERVLVEEATRAAEGSR
jgi:small-conductance mechanosensitive channel